MHAAAVEAGRPAGALTGAVYLTLALDVDADAGNARIDAYLESYYGAPAAVIRRRQTTFAGPPEAAADWIGGYAERGASHIALRFVGDHERSWRLSPASGNGSADGTPCEVSWDVMRCHVCHGAGVAVMASRPSGCALPALSRTAGDGVLRAAPLPFAPCPEFGRHQPADEFPPADIAFDRAAVAALVQRDRPEPALHVFQPRPEFGRFLAAGIDLAAIVELVLAAVIVRLRRGRRLPRFLFGLRGRLGQVRGAPVEHGEEFAQMGELGAPGAVAVGAGAVVRGGGSGFASWA